MHVSHFTKCGQIQKELEQKQFELLLKHYNGISPHPAEGSDGSGLSPGDDSLDDDAQDILDMKFLNIVAWDRASKQIFAKNSDSGESKKPRSQSVVLRYHGTNTSDQKNMSSLEKYVTKKDSGEIPIRKLETADKAPKPGMEVEDPLTKIRSASSPAKLGLKKRGRIDLGTGISSRGKDTRVKKTLQDQKPLNLFQTEFIHVKLSKTENKDSHEGQVEHLEESKDISPKPNTSRNQGKATNLGFPDDQDPFAKAKKKVGGLFNRGRGNNN